MRSRSATAQAWRSRTWRSLLARAGEPLDRLVPETLKPRPPRNPWLRQGIAGLRIVCWAGCCCSRRSSLSGGRRRCSERARPPRCTCRTGSRLRRLVSSVLSRGCVLADSVYAALLRIDAITLRYGPVSSAGLAGRACRHGPSAPGAIRPAWFPWMPPPIYPPQGFAAVPLQQRSATRT